MKKTIMTLTLILMVGVALTAQTNTPCDKSEVKKPKNIDPTWTEFLVAHQVPSCPDGYTLQKRTWSGGYYFPNVDHGTVGSSEIGHYIWGDVKDNPYSDPEYRCHLDSSKGK